MITDGKKWHYLAVKSHLNYCKKLLQKMTVNAIASIASVTQNRK